MAVYLEHFWLCFLVVLSGYITALILFMLIKTRPELGERIFGEDLFRKIKEE